MRFKKAIVICLIILLSGCSSKKDPLDRAILLRNTIQESEGCSFQATVTADFGDKYYVFTMDCISDKEGNMKFTVSKPETIAGITGQISTKGGELIFDDKILTFPTIIDGQITPVITPWLLIKSLKGGYINSCTTESGGYKISIDDSFADNAFRLFVYVENDIPHQGEIFWKGSRILSISVDNFTYM